MGSSVKAMSVHCDVDNLWVGLLDGRTLSVPLVWFPRLMHATAVERAACWISSRGLHWEGLDEDISVAGLLEGRGDRTRVLQDVA